MEYLNSLVDTITLRRLKSRPSNKFALEFKDWNRCIIDASEHGERLLVDKWVWKEQRRTISIVYVWNDKKVMLKCNDHIIEFLIQDNNRKKSNI